MAISTYAELKERVKDYVIQTGQEVNSDLLDDLTESLESRIWGVLRVREMQSYYTFTYAAGGEDIANFDDGNIIEVKSLLVDTSSSSRKPVPPSDEESLRMWMITSDTDSPKLHGWISEADGTAKLAIGPEPTGKTVHVSYWRKFDPMPSSTNAVFTTYPHIWMYGLLAEVFLYLRDMPMYQTFENKLVESITLANKQGLGVSDAHRGRGAGPQNKIGRVY